MKAHASLLLLLTIAACEPRTTVTLGGHGEPPAALTEELYLLVGRGGIGFADKPEAGARSLSFKTQWELEASERDYLNEAFTLLAETAFTQAAVQFSVTWMASPAEPGADAAAGTRPRNKSQPDTTAKPPPEKLTVTLERGRGGLELRSQGSGSTQLCVWEVPMDRAVPQHLTHAMWARSHLSDSPPDRPYQVEATSAVYAPLARQLEFHDRRVASFVAATKLDALSTALGGSATSDEFIACVRHIASPANAQVACQLAFPHLCQWLASHKLSD